MSARAALIDVSDTEWRLRAIDCVGDRLEAALIDVSDTEWRDKLQPTC